MEDSTSPASNSSVSVSDGRWDTLFDVLRDRRRRFVVHRLHASEHPLSIDELATQLSAWERRQPVDEVETRPIERAEVTLRHVHLPKLADAELVQYDRHSDEVSMSEQVAPLDALLAVVTDE